MAKMQRQPALPLGTSPDIFSLVRTTVSVPLSEMDHGSWLDLEYDNEEHAQRAWQALSERLQDGSAPSASELRRDYSIANVLSFLADHLPRDGFCGACVDALIRVDADGLHCKLPSGDWIPLQYENVRESTAIWHSEKSDRRSLDGGVASVYRLFKLPTDQSHERWSPVFISADQCRFLDR